MAYGLPAWVASASTSFSSAATSDGLARYSHENSHHEELNLPAVVNKICRSSAAWCWLRDHWFRKSTTLAAMIDRINANRADHLITIEDPIEFLHRDKKSFINSAKSKWTRNFSTPCALPCVDPDVILVGEMRDLETISTALLAAETGHLVLSTLHTLELRKRFSVLSPSSRAGAETDSLAAGCHLKAVVSQALFAGR